jgi:CHAT domain-containing protein
MGLAFSKTAKILACCLITFPFSGSVSNLVSRQVRKHFSSNANPESRATPGVINLDRGVRGDRAPLDLMLREGRDLFRNGRLAEAEERFERLWKSALESRQLDLAARALGNAGACQFATHRYQQASRSFIEAHRLAMVAGDRSGAAIFELNLASLYSEMGELESAVEWTERSIGMLTGRDRGEHRAELLIQLGSLRARQGRRDESEQLFRQGIETADRERNRSLYALGWNRFGEELMRHGDYAEAERAFLEAYRVRHLHGLALTGSYINLGKARLKAGDLETAGLLLDRALESSRQAQTVPALDAYRARGEVRLREQRFEEALHDLRIAIRLERAWRWAAPGTEAARVGAENLLAETQGLLIEAGNRLYLRNGERALIRETFEVAEENRANSLRMLIAARSFREQERPPAYWDAIARLQRAEIAVLRDNTAKAHAEARAARAELVRIEAEWAPDAPKLSGNLLDRVQTALDKETALLSFHLGDPVSWLWAVDRSGLLLYALPGRKEIEAQVRAAAQSTRDDAPEAAADGAALYQTLFAPLGARFHLKKRWLVALDMSLFDAPLAALMDIAGAEGVYLAERHIIQVISGAGAWLDASRPARSQDTELFVGVGDPIYNRADPRLDHLSTQTEVPSIALPRLVSSGAEIEGCARSWKEQHVLLRGADVSRLKLLEVLDRKPAAIHFATHFLQASDRTGAMIPLGLGGGQGAEILPAAEISRLKIHGAMVVMSGCHSAAGVALRASGLLGLTRAWLAAGARSVVASRWPTPDEDGALFRSFYRDLRNNDRESAAVALRAAQLEMLSSGGWRARPRYWGAYFVMGNE